MRCSVRIITSSSLTPHPGFSHLLSLTLDQGTRMSLRALSLSSPFIFLLTFSILPPPSTPAIDTFVYGGCTPIKYVPGSTYESKLNSLLTSLVNSASFTTYNNFSFVGSNDAIYGLFQCRGDLSNGDCGRCVTRAVSQLGTICGGACGGALQMEGCFVKYDNTTFLGVEDKTVVVKKCGPMSGYESDELSRRDAVLAYMMSGGGPYRVGTSGNAHGVAQCVGDLALNECNDCLTYAVGRLRSDCNMAAWGDVFLAKCYARFSEGWDHSRGSGKRFYHAGWWFLLFTLYFLVYFR